MSIEDQVKQSMEESLQRFQKELQGLRTSRANPSVLNSVVVEVYGTQTRLKDIASVTAPEPRQLLITPYDPNNAAAIGKAIEAANLNLMPITEGNLVRINIPPMDEDMRKEISRQCKKQSEDAKVAIREIRRKNNDLVRKQKSDGEIPEDLMKRLEKKIQDLTDEYCKKIDQLCDVKQKEIMMV